jgi:hypothetical protein
MGIDTIDTATAYEWDWTKASSYFNVVLKVKIDDAVDTTFPSYCLMAHDVETAKSFRRFYDARPCRLGISLYEIGLFPFGDIALFDVIQLPYSVFDRRAEVNFAAIKNAGKEIHVRSIFLRGKVLEKVKPHEAIMFCLMNPYIDKVILGADSFEQFRSNLAPLFYMNSLKKDDPNIIDPRKW